MSVVPQSAGSGQRLPVHECFHTWQGEGVHTGRAAFFIRLFGCPVQCPWCDAAGTWHPDWIPERVERMSAEDLTRMAVEASPAIVVVTGGEPAIHDLGPLTRSLRSAGLPVHLETSGGFEIRGVFDWVTVSPKWQKPPLDACLQRADELKLIVEHADSIGAWWKQIGSKVRRVPVWLQPEWSRRTDPAVLGAISGWVKRHGDPFRAAWQMHKLYRVDEADVRSQAPAPLGGDLAKGW
jgi:organic radical activating enzyme